MNPNGIYVIGFDTNENKNKLRKIGGNKLFRDPRHSNSAGIQIIQKVNKIRGTLPHKFGNLLN